MRTLSLALSTLLLSAMGCSSAATHESRSERSSEALGENEGPKNFLRRADNGTVAYFTFASPPAVNGYMETQAGFGTNIELHVGQFNDYAAETILARDEFGNLTAYVMDVYNQVAFSFSQGNIGREWELLVGDVGNGFSSYIGRNVNTGAFYVWEAGDDGNIVRSFPFDGNFQIGPDTEVFTGAFGDNRGFRVPGSNLLARDQFGNLFVFILNWRFGGVSLDSTYQIPNASLGRNVRLFEGGTYPYDLLAEDEGGALSLYRFGCSPNCTSLYVDYAPLGDARVGANVQFLRGAHSIQRPSIRCHLFDPVYCRGL